MSWNRILSIFFILSLLVVSAVQADPVINPVVTSKPFWCKFFLTGWICENNAGATGPQGPQGVAGESGNTTIYNVTSINNSSFFNLTGIVSDMANFYNTTVNGNLTFNGNISFYNITISQMNQTANMTAGPQGSPGPIGPMNMTANLTAGPQGPTGPMGHSATADVNYTFTVPNGTPANVVNIGDSLDARFNFYIPGGPDGVINMSKVYPIGIVIMEYNSGDNPNSTLGFGNWTCVQGCP